MVETERKILNLNALTVKDLDKCKGM